MFSAFKNDSEIFVHTKWKEIDNDSQVMLIEHQQKTILKTVSVP